MTISQVNILDSKMLSGGKESFSWFSSPPAQGIFESVWAIIILTLWQSKKQKRLLVPFSLISYIFPLFTPCNQRDFGMAMYFMHLGQ